MSLQPSLAFKDVSFLYLLAFHVLFQLPVLPVSHTLYL